LGTPLLLIGNILYLTVEPAVLQTWLGTGGSAFFRSVFESVGLAAFLLPIFYASYLVVVIQRFEEFRQALRSYDFHVLKFLSFAFLGMISAVLLGVLEAYYGLGKTLQAGLGGDVGRSLGFALFEMFGIYGSLSAITLFVLAVTILGGWVDVVGLCVAGVAGVSRLASSAWTDFQKKSVQAPRASAIKREHFSEFEEEELTREHTFSGVAKTSRVVNAPDRTHSEESFEREEPVKERKLRAVKVEEEASHEVSESEASEQKPARRKRKAKVEVVESVDVLEETLKVESEPVEKEYSVDLKAYTKRYANPSKNLVTKQSKIKTPSKKDLAEKAKVIEERLTSFGVNGKVTDIHPGIRLTMFEFLPDSGIKLSKISGLGSDLALLLGAPSIRILAPIPGKTTVGIEVPNEDTSILSFATGLDELAKVGKGMNLPIVIGQDVSNKMIVSDLSAMPHMLVSGTTGSGKSVFVNTLISSLLYSKSPKDLRMIMVDPKMIELTPYNEIPHLAVPVISDVEEAKDALVWAEKEMDKRYQIFSEMGARNLESFNEKIKKVSKKRVEGTLGRKIDWNWEHMPYLVIVIDELADLMITQGKEVEIPITRIAQKARAAGIHLVLCTQRPSADIVTGLIKTNFPTRISFKVSSNIDSRTILDQSGAEKLLGNGDMLYLPNGKSIQRLQGAFLSESDVNAVVASIKK